MLEEAKLARDLVNEIPAKADPEAMVQAFGAGVRRHGLKLDVWRRKELEANGMNGLLAVGASSCHEPALLFLTYEPRVFSRTVVLVGKGITFDSGGLNLKPGNSMEEMKSDMAGAAVVWARLKTVAAPAPAGEDRSAWRPWPRTCPAAAPTSPATSSPTPTRKRWRSSTPTPRAG